MRITVWNEFRHERFHDECKKVYPEGIHTVIAEFLREAGFDVGTATLDEPEHGLTDEVLNNTDVLFWWGHMAHGEVKDEIVEKVHDRVVNGGMGLIVLHSGHASKIFNKLCGTASPLLSWREDGKLERLWLVDPSHPIAAGLPQYIEIPHTEMYGEYFNIPQPDEQIFISWFEGGEVCRSGFVLRRGRGRVFYFRPGHETFPIYRQKEVQQVLINAAKYVCPAENAPVITYRSNVNYND